MEAKREAALNQVIMEAKKKVRAAVISLTTRIKPVEDIGEAQSEKAEHTVMHTRVKALYLAMHMEATHEN